ncbi:MAG TPA: hypothetical protein VI299_13135, partial [Polyangiales bacterium]
GQLHEDATVPTDGSMNTATPQDAAAQSCSCGANAGCGAAGSCECLEGFVGPVTSCRAASRRLAATDAACAILKNGSVWCWQGFAGSTDPTPHKIDGIDDAVEVASGGSHACARRANGEVACWGLNSQGQLGNGGAVDSVAPVAVIGLRNTKSIAARMQHTCVVDEDDHVQCWGANPACVLGYCGNASRVPVPIKGISNVKKLALGFEHTCALKTDGTVMCWGNQTGGALGNGVDSTAGAPTPAPVPGVANASDVAAGVYWSCALYNGLSCWGRNRYDDVTDFDTLVPLTIVAPPVLGTLAAGRSHLCVRAANAVLCRGANFDGQLGDGTNAHTPSASGTSSSFVTVRGLTNAVDISADVEATCALTSEDRVLCWGNDGSGATRNVPVQITF